MKIIDMHQHLLVHDGLEGDRIAEALVETQQKNNISQTWILPGITGEQLFETGNDEVQAAFERYPDRFRGMGLIILGRDKADKVRELKERGFFGIKIIYPAVPYDDPVCDEIWQECIEQRMPVLFHTGASVVCYYDVRKYEMNPDWMRPGKLMRVAMYFPELVFIMAHMGNVQINDACAVARHKNAYMDTSGAGRVQTLPASFFDNIVYWTDVQDKLLWGSDQYFKWTDEMIEKTQKFADTVKLSQENRELLWHGNAEKIIEYVLGSE